MSSLDYFFIVHILIGYLRVKIFTRALPICKILYSYTYPQLSGRYPQVPAPVGKIAISSRERSGGGVRWMDMALRRARVWAVKQYGKKKNGELVKIGHNLNQDTRLKTTRIRKQICHNLNQDTRLRTTRIRKQIWAVHICSRLLHRNSAEKKQIFFCCKARGLQFFNWFSKQKLRSFCCSAGLGLVSKQKLALHSKLFS